MTVCVQATSDASRVNKLRTFCWNVAESMQLARDDGGKFCVCPHLDMKQRLNSRSIQLSHGHIANRVSTLDGEWIFRFCLS